MGMPTKVRTVKERMLRKVVVCDCCGSTSREGTVEVSNYLYSYEAYKHVYEYWCWSCRKSLEVVVFGERK